MKVKQNQLIKNKINKIFKNQKKKYFNFLKNHTKEKIQKKILETIIFIKKKYIFNEFFIKFRSFDKKILLKLKLRCIEKQF